MEAFIRFENIWKKFGDNEIYRGLSLEVSKGETMTIIGGSGTGKSVMLKMLLGLVKPDKGDIYFDGKSVFEMTHDELITMRKRVGMLFQGAALFDSLSVADNVAYPLREHFKYDEAKITKIVEEKLDVVGLKDTEDKMPSDLSGGMKKRVGLARAIATDAEVILYDEPTTGLDPTNTNRIDDLIVSLQERFKITSLVVTHDMQSAFQVSDRLALIYDKKIEFVGTVDEVKASDNKIVMQFIQGQIGQ